MSRKESPGKRTDPGKLMKDRQAIQKDLEQRSRPKPLEGFINLFQERLTEKKRKKAGYGSAPRVKGAFVSGFKPTQGDA